MKLFLDTSSLFKLYHNESDTEIIDGIFNNSVVSSVYLSEITIIEFHSTSWKKVRKLEIAEADAEMINETFENDQLDGSFSLKDLAPSQFLCLRP